MLATHLGQEEPGGRFKSRERQRLNPEASKVRAAFVATQMDKLVKRTGASPAAAKQVVTRWCDGVLLPDIELEFDDEDLRGCTVGDVLAEPEKFLGATLADPLEGVEYGRTVAKILRGSTGELWIHSFAHGKTVYDLKHDVASVRRSMEAAAEEDVLKTFTRMVVMAAVDAEEMEELQAFSIQAEWLRCEHCKICAQGSAGRVCQKAGGGSARGAPHIPPGPARGVASAAVRRRATAGHEDAQ